MSQAGLRRVLHVASAAVLLGALIVDWRVLRYILTLAAAVGALLEWVRLSYVGVAPAVARAFPVFRPEERHRPSGAMWLLIGYASASWVPLPGPPAGILAAALADPAASLIGSRWGGGEQKSRAGTGAAIGVSAAVLALLGLPWSAVAAGSLATGALERWCGRLDDNLLLAPGVALTVWLVG